MKTLVIAIAVLAGFGNAAAAGSAFDFLRSAAPALNATQAPPASAIKAVPAGSNDIKAAARVLAVSYSAQIKDADKKYFDAVYAKNTSGFYNVGRQLVGNKIDQAEFFVAYATRQSDRAVYLVKISVDNMAISKFRADVLANGKVEYSQAED
ncbi:MAG TPA: hypothetical protein DCL44_06025 [Elusimicrobia bacterium]|nr:hypothetical protein [Elusimicrobiota bacterium]